MSHSHLFGQGIVEKIMAEIAERPATPLIDWGLAPAKIVYDIVPPNHDRDSEDAFRYMMDGLEKAKTRIFRETFKRNFRWFGPRRCSTCGCHTCGCQDQAGTDPSTYAYIVAGRDCTCLRCRGEVCHCSTMRMPPCSICTDSCDPDDPETRMYVDRCPKCGNDECGCQRTAI